MWPVAGIAPLYAQEMCSPRGRLHYGLHTSLLDFNKGRIVKVLVFDDLESRVKRAMQQEEFTEKVAREHVQRHDEKVSNWTYFLFHRPAYDRSLYDIVISLKKEDILDLTTDIVEQFKDVEISQPSFQAHAVLPALENHFCMADHIGGIR